jgi:hypothetical protein
MAGVTRAVDHLWAGTLTRRWKHDPHLHRRQRWLIISQAHLDAHAAAQIARHNGVAHICQTRGAATHASSDVSATGQKHANPGVRLESTPGSSNGRRKGARRLFVIHFIEFLL